MIKLNAHKNSKVKFNIDVSNMKESGLQGFFRLMHEGVEYGFPVHVFANGSSASVSVPALEDILPNLTEGSKFDVKLEFISGGDYVAAWKNKAEIYIPPKPDVVVQEVIIQNNDTKELPKKVEANIEGEEPSIIVEKEADVLNIEVSDNAWEAAKKIKPSKVKVEEKREPIDLTYKSRPKEKEIFPVSDEAWEAAKKKPQKILL